jgi:hypothetical protein
VRLVSSFQRIRSKRSTLLLANPGWISEENQHAVSNTWRLCSHLLRAVHVPSNTKNENPLLMISGHVVRVRTKRKALCVGLTTNKDKTRHNLRL